jgi:hypothetical protein
MDETADATMEQRKKRIEPEMAAEEEEREKKQTAKEQKGGRLGIISATTRENESTRGDQKRKIRIRTDSDHSVAKEWEG